MGELLAKPMEIARRGAGDHIEIDLPLVKQCE